MYDLGILGTSNDKENELSTKIAVWTEQVFSWAL